MLATAGLIASTSTAQNKVNADPPAIDMTILHAQVILDRLGFSPGVIDGRQGQSFKLALRGLQTAHDLPVTGRLDDKTIAYLHRYRAIRPVRELVVGPDQFAQPFQGRLPDDPSEQAKLPALGYANLLEKLAEKFHTTPHTIAALNPPGTLLKPGARIRFPNALPTSRAYPADLPDHWKQTLNDLNVDARQPEGDRVVVDKSEGVLKVYDKEDRLVAQLPATMGSGHDPLPIGRWKIQGESYNPPFHYNPDLFWDADSKDEKVKLPPGPNGPVGVIWLDLNKPHYGIHGTSHPETIGRAESHGCIRLSNWDAARLSLMVKPGTLAVFQE